MENYFSNVFRVCFGGVAQSVVFMCWRYIFNGQGRTELWTIHLTVAVAFMQHTIFSVIRNASKCTILFRAHERSIFRGLFSFFLFAFFLRYLGSFLISILWRLATSAQISMANNQVCCSLVLHWLQPLTTWTSVGRARMCIDCGFQVKILPKLMRRMPVKFITTISNWTAMHDARTPNTTPPIQFCMCLCAKWLIEFI